MSVRSRSTLSLACALGVLAVAQPARAQSVSLVPSAPSVDAAIVPASSPSAARATAGPTLDNATVAVRHQADTEAPAAARRGGSAPGTALMIFGGAAILVGLVVGGPAGGAIAVGGAVVGLIGLYEYLQ